MSDVAVPTRKLGALVALQTAKAFGIKDPKRPYVGLEQLASGEPQILGTLPISESVSVNSVFETGDILFGKLRPNLRKCAAAPFPGYCSTDILVLRARPGVSDRFAAHALHSERVFAAAVQSAMGTKMPRTNWSALQSLEVFAPEKEREQTRIADILDTLDEAIREAEAVIAKLRQVKAGLLHDLLTRGLDENGRLRDPIRHPDQFQNSPLGLIPKAWEVKTLQDVTTRITDGAHTTVKTVEASSETVPFLFVSCIRDGRVLWDQAGAISRSTYHDISRGREPSTGMVLFTVVGSYGHAALVQDDSPFSFQRHIACLYPRNDKIDSRFLVHWMNSPRFKSFGDNAALGNAQKTITLGALNSLPCILPLLFEQEEIMRTVSPVDSRLAAEQDYLTKLQSLKRGLSHDLLTGQKRVKM